MFVNIFFKAAVPTMPTRIILLNNFDGRWTGIKPVLVREYQMQRSRRGKPLASITESQTSPVF